MKEVTVIVFLLLFVVSCGGGGASNPGGNQTELEPPTNVSASDGLLTDRIRITWVHPRTAVAPDGYRIYRFLYPNDPLPVVVGTVGYVQVFDDMFVSDDVTYYYGVMCFKTGYANSSLSVLASGYKG